MTTPTPTPSTRCSHRPRSKPTTSDSNRLRGICRAVGLLPIILGVSMATATASEPYTPTDLDTVVFELSSAAKAYQPPRVNGIGDRVAAAAQAIRHFQRSGNPRDLSTAESLLENLPSPEPAEARLIRAYISQARHDFAAAQRQLEAVVDIYPGMAHAWTMLADVHRVSGRLDEAKLACRKRLALAADAAGLVCFASILGLTGETDKANTFLTQAADSLPPSHPMQSWINGTRAEIAVRENELANAAQLYEKAMRIDDPPLYLVTEYVDVLLKRNEPRKALAVLENYPENSALLVRKAMALRALDRNEWREVDETLQELFALERRRGDAIHLRERAAWALYVRQRPDEALRSAQRNFVIQKEPEDVRLLIAAAAAADDADAAKPAIQFLQRYRPRELNRASTDSSRREAR